MTVAAGGRRSALPPWASAALLIAGVTVVARVIGLVRLAVLARTLGTDCLGDVYVTANAIPNIVYELVIGGALAAVVVPLVAGARERDPAEVRATIAALHGWALVLLVPVTAAMYLLSPLAIDLLLPEPDQCAGDAATVATQMLWVFLLQIPVYGATVVAQGALQAHRRFFAPAVAPALSSLVVIGAYLSYAALAGDDLGSLEALTREQFWILAGGTTLAVFVLLLAQLPALLRGGLVVLPRLTFPAGRGGQAWTLAWSGAVVVASQWVGYAVAIRWSNRYGDPGSALVFILAWMLFLLPWAVLAFPIATSTFPRLSALFETGRRGDAARTIATTTRAVAAVSAAGAGAMAAASTPAASVLVDSDAVPALAAILLALAPGVLAYGIGGHLVRVLAAQHRAPVAAAATATGWLVGIAVAWVGVRSAVGAVDVARSIGLGFSLGLVVGALLLGLAVVALDGREALGGVLILTVVTAVAAAAVGGLGVWLWSGDDVAVVTALLQSAAAGAAALGVVGGAAALVDPQSARTLLRVPGRRSSGRAGADARADD